MVYSTYVKQRILALRREGLSYGKIAKALQEEGHSVTKSGVHQFAKSYDDRGTISRKTGSGKKSIVNDDIKRTIEEQMNKDDETTIEELKAILTGKGYSASLSSIGRWRCDLGWTSKSTKYCQMIREKNVEKRLQWALEHKRRRGDFPALNFYR